MPTRRTKGESYWPMRIIGRLRRRATLARRRSAGQARLLTACCQEARSPLRTFCFRLVSPTVHGTIGKPPALSKPQARRLWLRAQRLDTPAPFGGGPEATRAAVEHLGYVQSDTINVIERCHHHILYSRIPDYRRADLKQAQSVDKSVFEYWTHALSYVPSKDLRFFLPAM